MVYDYISNARKIGKTPFYFTIARNNGNHEITIRYKNRDFILLFAHKKVSVYEFEKNERFLIRDGLLNLQSHAGINEDFAEILYYKLNKIREEELDLFHSLFVKREFFQIAQVVGFLITGTMFGAGNISMDEELIKKANSIAKG